jgi:hypothetical protein
MVFQLDPHPLRTEQIKRVFIFFGETEQGMRMELESLIGPDTLVTESDAYTQSKGGPEGQAS